MTLFDTIYFSDPSYLILIFFVLFLYILKRENKVEQNQLTQFIEPKLLKHLVSKQAGQGLPSWVGLILVSLMIVGIAGISWEKKAETKYITPKQTIIILDQSLSMYATDIKPNRLTRVKQKVQDLLSHIKEGNIALTAFAGDAYVISPFSQDKTTLKHFLLALDPLIMPLYGSDAVEGLRVSLELIQDPNQYTNVILFTDDIKTSEFQGIQSLVNQYNIKLNIIGVGTKEGGNIQLPDGKILRTAQGKVLTKLPTARLTQFAQEINASYYPSDLLPNDIEDILTPKSNSGTEAVEANSQSIDWVDKGHWFALPFLCWLLYQFRAGVMVVLLISLIPYSPSADASWLDWFRTKDQQAQKLVDQGDWQAAQTLFENKKWQAASDYALGNYESAAEQLETLNFEQTSAKLQYNQGNSFALAGKLDAAISAYEKALIQQPDFKEAQENLDYLKQLQQQAQEQNQQNSDQQQSNSDQEQNDGEQQENPSDQEQNPEPKDSEESDSEKEQADNANNQDSAEEQTPEQGQEQEQTPPKQEETPLTSEEQVALNQWMRQIQDDPGGLLKRKLWYLHQEKRAENRYRQQDGHPIW